MEDTITHSYEMGQFLVVNNSPNSLYELRSGRGADLESAAMSFSICIQGAKERSEMTNQ